MPTEYKPAPDEVLAVMEAVIDRHPKFTDLRKHDVRIEVLMAFSDNDEPVKKHGVVALACVKIVPGEERAQQPAPDVRIKVDGKRYAALVPRSREAMFAHELYHLEVQYRDGGGVKTDAYSRPVVKTIPDDWCINGFRKVAEWYGDASIEVKHHRAVAEILGQGTLPLEKEAGQVSALDELREVLFPSPPPPDPEMVLLETPIEDIPIEDDARAALQKQEITTFGEAEDFLAEEPTSEGVARLLGIEASAAASLRGDVETYRTEFEQGLPKAAPEPADDQPATFLVFKGTSRKPLYAIRAATMLAAIRLAKGRAAGSYNPRVALDEQGKAKSLGLEAVYAPPVEQQQEVAG